MRHVRIPVGHDLLRGIRLPGNLTMLEDDLERETGIEPATNGLGSRYSTIELLPHLG